jgi:hypothetical protein
MTSTNYVRHKTKKQLKTEVDTSEYSARESFTAIPKVVAGMYGFGNGVMDGYTSFDLSSLVIPCGISLGSPSVSALCDIFENKPDLETLKNAGIQFAHGLSVAAVGYAFGYLGGKTLTIFS